MLQEVAVAVPPLERFAHFVALDLVNLEVVVHIFAGALQASSLYNGARMDPSAVVDREGALDVAFHVGDHEVQPGEGDIFVGVDA